MMLTIAFLEGNKIVSDTARKTVSEPIASTLIKTCLSQVLQNKSSIQTTGCAWSCNQVSTKVRVSASDLCV